MQQIFTFYFSNHFLIFSCRNKKKDIEAIKGMCGCMDIEFKFAEHFHQIKIINIMITIHQEVGTSISC